MNIKFLYYIMNGIVYYVLVINFNEGQVIGGAKTEMNIGKHNTLPIWAKKDHMFD